MDIFSDIYLLIKNSSEMKVLIFTHMYPSMGHPENGIFVKEQVDSLVNAGIDIDVLFCDVKKTKWLYPLSLFFLWKKIIENKYDLVHAHYVFAGIIARFQFILPVVITHHGEEAFHTYQKYLCWIISRLVNKTIVVSSQMKNAIGLEKIKIIPCGVDFNKFHPMDKNECKKKLGLSENKTYLLFAGDITKSLKRFDLVKEAVEILKQSRKNIELIVAYKRPYEEVVLYMNAASIMLFPSEREGSPQVVKEALACNLPVIASDAGDISEIFNGINGCYIVERKAITLAEKTDFILNNIISSDGRDKIRRYELNEIAKQVIGVYKSIVCKKE